MSANSSPRLLVWVRSFLLITTTVITPTAPTVPNAAQLQRFQNNETIDTAVLQQPRPNVFFTDAQNFTTSDTFLLPPSQRPHSNSTIAPLAGLVLYPVEDSNPPLELGLHSFGRVIPEDGGLATITAALAVILPFILEKHGRHPITAGVFKFTQQFPNYDNVSFSVADFREMGEEKAISYYTLADTLKGVGEFFKEERADEWREVSFELELGGRGRGYVGSGHLARSLAKGTTSTGLADG